MNEEKYTNRLIKNVQPYQNAGQYVFISASDTTSIPYSHVICIFKEKEGTTMILSKENADELNLPYSFIAAWITLEVYSSLEAVGLTAKVAQALAQENISCNAIAAYHHDHIFVPFHRAERAMTLLRKL